LILHMTPASRGDALWFVPRLRPEDQREAETGSGRSVAFVLQRAHALSRECYTIRLGVEEEPVALFGVMDDFSQAPGWGVPWLLATSGVTRGSRAIIRSTDYWFDQRWAPLYPKGLHTAVDVRNTLHVRWLHLAGFVPNRSTILNGHEFLHLHRSPRSV